MNNTIRISSMMVLLCAALASARAEPPALREIAPRLKMSDAMTLPAGKQLYQRGPAIAGGGAGYLLVWQDGYNGLGGESDILGLRLDANGTAVDGKPIAVGAGKDVQDSPAVALGGGKYLVAWADFRNGKDYDIYAAFVDSKGEVGKEFLLSGGPGGQAAPAVAFDGKDTFFVVWQDHRGGKQFEIYGARVSASGAKLLDPDGIKVLAGGASPKVVFNGSKFLVTIGETGCLVDADGKASGPVELWSGKAKNPGGQSVTAAYGKTIELLNVAPFPDPWGWGHNGSILGISVTPDGQSPESKAARHGWYEAGNDRADRVTKNVIQSARWKNHNGWPMGMPGGFKGSHDGTWPSGPTACAFDGRSILAVWTTANFIDILHIANRDLYLKRVLDDWAYVDEPVLKIVAGPTEETNPALASDGAGNAILAYERQNPDGGVLVEYRLIVEAEDTDPPRVAYIQKMSDAQLIVGFDEPIDVASVKTENFSIDGAAVKSAVFVAENPSLQREVKIETEPLTAGKSYALKIKGVTDRSPKKNAMTGAPVEYVARPGTAQRSDFIEKWLTIGKWPANYDVDYVDAANVRPSPGETVKGPTDDALVEAMKKAKPADKGKDEDLAASVPKTFGGDKQWKETAAEGRCVLRLSNPYGKTEMAVAYAGTYVFSDRERDAILRVDSNDGNRVWLNGKVIASNPAAPKGIGRGTHDRTDEIDAKLIKGWNTLLIEVDNHVGIWTLVAQFTDKNRQPIRDLTYQLQKP